MATVGTAFVLHLDRAGLGTPTPATEVVGTADTIDHLYWLARGAAHFERGGRLWAENADTGECLTLGDLGIKQRCEGCGRGVEDCDRERPPRTEGATECDGRRRRRELAERVANQVTQRREALALLEEATRACAGALPAEQATRLESAGERVVAAFANDAR